MYPLGSFDLIAGACRLAQLLPARYHSGKRALNGLACAGLLSEPDVGRRILLSQWCSARWTAWAKSSSPLAIRQKLKETVNICWTDEVLDQFNGPRGVIFSTPHYGAFVWGCLAVINDTFACCKPFNLFYDAPSENPFNADFEMIFSKALNPPTVHHTSRKGIIAALRALRRGEALTMMPDVIHDSRDAFSVPFLGRMIRAMPGTAFLARAGDAVIIPAYCTADRKAVNVIFSAPIDPRNVDCSDVEQADFEITAAIYEDMAEHFRRAPEHWIYWDTFPRLSSAVGLADHHRLGDWGSCLRAIRHIVETVPDVLTMVPAIRYLFLTSTGVTEQIKQKNDGRMR